MSVLAVGTAALGMVYGLPVPGVQAQPRAGDAVSLLRWAVEAGVNFFDTAPSYGSAERLLGEALAGVPDCWCATKVRCFTDEQGVALSGASLQQAVEESVRASLRISRKDVLDVVQIHNATAEVIARGEIAACLHKLRERGAIRFIGASVYREEEALAAIRSGEFDMIQVAYNLLDQRMAVRVFEAGAARDVGVLTRSAFLKGALTPRADHLPAALAPLRGAAERARDDLAEGKWDNLPEVALRFCLSNPAVASVLVGVQSEDELNRALAAVAQGPLPDSELKKTAAVALTDDRLLNPSKWPTI